MGGGRCKAVCCVCKTEDLSEGLLHRLTWRGVESRISEWFVGWIVVRLVAVFVKLDTMVDTDFTV